MFCLNMNKKLFRSFDQQGHGNKSTFAYRSSSSTRVSHAICCVNRSHWSVSFSQHKNMTKYIHKGKKKGTRQRINVLIDQNGSPGLLFGVGGREGEETSVTAISSRMNSVFRHQEPVVSRFPHIVQGHKR